MDAVYANCILSFNNISKNGIVIGVFKIESAGVNKRIFRKNGMAQFCFFRFEVDVFILIHRKVYFIGLVIFLNTQHIWVFLCEYFRNYLGSIRTWGFFIRIKKADVIRKHVQCVFVLRSIHLGRNFIKNIEIKKGNKKYGKRYKKSAPQLNGPIKSEKNIHNYQQGNS